MPLSVDETINKTSQALVDQLQAIFGKHPGFRPAHAHGQLLTGTFTPSAEASKLSSAPHFNNSSIPIKARFSSSTGIPTIPDNDANANPRGMAVRFDLGGRHHTDIIAHSVPLFPTRTGAEFLEMLRAIAASATAAVQGISPSPVEKFFETHPHAYKFATYPKPSPDSFATEQYFGVNAFKFVNGEGKETFVRYTLQPGAGVKTLSDDEAREKSATYLFDELPKRLEAGPVVFKLLGQIAEEGDVTDDHTQEWPEERKKVELGTIEIKEILPVQESLREQKHIIFDPIPRVQGVEATADPLLEIRAAVYLISGRQRRAA